MFFSRGFKKFKSVTVLAAVLAVISGIVPESAEAIILRFSGNPNSGETTLEFNLDTSVPNTSSEPDKGVFEGAIKDAKYSCKVASWCTSSGTDKTEFYFSPATLYASQAEILPDNRSEARYEAELRGQPPYESVFIQFFILVIQDRPNSFNIIDSLSELSSLLINHPGNGQVNISNLNSKNGLFIGAGSNFQVVPEPNSASSLLCFGSLGAVSLLKRVKRSRKS